MPWVQYFSISSAGLGDVVVQVQEHLVADDLLVVDLGLQQRLADQWVSVLPIPIELEIPGQVVDARAGVGDFTEGRADPTGQHHGRPLHAVTQAG